MPSDAHSEPASREYLRYPPGYAIPLDICEHLALARLPEEQGDARALEAFLLRIYWPLRRAIAARFKGMSGWEEATREVTQDAMLNVLSHIDRCRGHSERQVWAWIWKVTQNAATDYLRAQLPRLAGRLFVEEFERVSGLVSWRDWRAWVDDQPPSGEFVLFGVIMELYEKMPEETAEFIWYRIVAHATYPELAEIFGTTPAGARRRWQRARATLRKSALTMLDHMPPGPEREAARAALDERMSQGAASDERSLDTESRR